MTEREAAVIEAAEKMVAVATSIIDGENAKASLASDLVDLLHEFDFPMTAEIANHAFTAIRAARDELRAALDATNPTGDEP